MSPFSQCSLFQSSPIYVSEGLYGMPLKYQKSKYSISSTVTNPKERIIQTVVLKNIFPVYTFLGYSSTPPFRILPKIKMAAI